jgi:hypothetical protein
VPFDLTVTISDERGEPIAGGNIVFPESGGEEAVQANEAGQFNWVNLPGPAVTLKVSAPGYFPQEQAASLERGLNEIKVTLERDPFGLLPSTACAPGEKLLYIEDFQDGKAQGWQNITAAMEFDAKNGWGINPLEEGNQVASFTGINENLDDLQNLTFDNAVWRLKIQTVGKDGFSFINWKHAPASGGETRYPIQWGANVLMDLTRLQFPDIGHFSVDTSALKVKEGSWYFLEISSYDGLVQVWVDGKLEIEYQDPQPLPAGMISLEAHIWNDPNTIYYFDDLSVCELSAAFTSIVPPAP